MSLLESWRRFIFFERDVVKDPEAPGDNFSGLQDMDVVGSCCGKNQILIGERSGGLTQVMRGWRINYWKAYNHSLYKMAFVVQHNILVTVGEDGPGVNAQLKVWQMDKLEKGSPFCSRVTRVSPPGNRPARVTALAVHSSLFYTAIGFEDSTLLLFRGEVTRDRNNKPQVVRDGATCASEGEMTGLAFHMMPDRRLILFVSTSHLNFALVLTDRDVERKCILDNEGCPDRSWAMSDAVLDHQYIVARKEMVFFYNPQQCIGPEEGAGGKCYGFQGEKVLIYTKGPYLVVVTKDGSNFESDQTMNMVTIYDIPQQYIAYSAPIPQVSDVFFEWGSFFILSKNGKLFHLIEKPIEQKLDILFKKNLFDLATDLAKRNFCDRENLSSIFKKYGDFLYRKGDFENSVREYIHTIGCLEPSYVIRKFLDAQRIKELTQYLEGLHKESLASVDHTTILLNCYTKLNDRDKIDRFVRNSGKELSFDVDTAIKVLHGADYTELAMYLAKEHERHDKYLHILLEKAGNYSEAIRYISQLEFDLASRFIKKYGKVLLREVPTETTSVLKELCTGYKASEQFEGERASSDEYINIFVHDSVRLREFLEHMSNVDKNSPPALYHTLLELYLREYSRELSQESKKKLQGKLLNFLATNVGRYDSDQALVLCQTHEFGPGTLFIHESSQRYPLILQYHMAAKDFPAVIETCRKFGQGGDSRDMWVEALWFFARNENVPLACISQLLQHIDEAEILPPLMVLEILSNSQSVTLGVVKDYLLSWLRQENQKIEKDEQRIAEHREEIGEIESTISNLKNKPQIFQISKCSACNSPLEVPTVHFLCKHSYHQSCFEGYAEKEGECPMCLPENRKLRAELNSQEKDGKAAYAQFRNDLHTSGDTIRTVAENFGKGFFGGRSNSLVGGDKGRSGSIPVRKEPLNPFGDDDDDE